MLYRSHHLLSKRMKLKTQTPMAVNDEQENGIDETKNKEKSSSTNIHLTEEDKEKGNFKHFNISKRTIKKLKGKLKFSKENLE